MPRGMYEGKFDLYRGLACLCMFTSLHVVVLFRDCMLLGNPVLHAPDFFSISDFDIHFIFLQRTAQPTDPDFFSISCAYSSRGRRPGIYYTWEECRQQVEGYSSAIFRGYKSASEAFTQWTAFCDVSAQQKIGVGEVTVDYDNMVSTHGPLYFAGCSNDPIGSSRSASYDYQPNVGHGTEGDSVEETPGALEALMRMIIGCLIIILAIYLFPCHII
ncbi:uncharacterized protein LOC131240188 [Magnolia sinica]|uniref:uncharacterized protein LOC131240188 n=1 Tax=Magnolia sinica TaxID=86752 RepID=UPI00265905D1|nr:uncharacterized protein LOC131240188 [Magnolia sinica]